MRRPAVLAGFLVLVVSGPTASAQTESSYEASSGLIPVSGFVVFFNARGPLSYAALTAKSLPAGAVPTGLVKGRGCQYGLSTPLVGLSSVPRLSGAGGEGGYERALRDIHERQPDLSGIYDVKVDDHVVIVLTVFQRQCTEVTARGFR